MTAVLAACSSSGDADSGGSSADGETFGLEAPAEAPAAAQDSSTASTGKSGAAQAGAGNDATGNNATGRARSGVQLDRAVISSGTVSLQSDDVAEARREVQRVVDAARGQVSEETTDSDDDGDAVYARLVVRVPSAGFDDAMTALEGVATLRSSKRTSEDVTTQVIDTDARLRAQEASLERVEALFGRADRLQQIVWIESQLTQRQAELDSLRQQQTWLADQTSLATITVDIERTPEKAKEKKDDDEAGFLAGLDGGMRALAAAATATATVAGALLPFAVLLAVLGAPLWLLRRGVRRRRPATQA